MRPVYPTFPTRTPSSNLRSPRFVFFPRFRFCHRLLAAARPGRPFVTRRDRSTTRSSEHRSRPRSFFPSTSTSPFIVIDAFYVRTYVCLLLRANFDRTDLNDRSSGLRLMNQFPNRKQVGKQEVRNSK